MRTSPRSASGISPLISLRADLAGRPATREDDDAIVIAALLRHAAGQPGTAAARRSLAAARRIVRRALSPDQLREGAALDEPGAALPFKPFRAFADVLMRVRGRAVLANGILDSLVALIPQESLERGWLLSQRAAMSWYLGDNELSAVRYREVIRLGKRSRQPDLVARGLHGIASVRMSVGNLPEAERLSKRALRVADKSSPRLSGQATLKLAIINAVRGNFDAALDYAWRSYQLAKRFEFDRQVVLANLAQMLYDAGHPAASRAAASHLLRLPLAHSQVFALLGTYARASAALADSNAVDWSASQLLELAKSPSFAQHVADALLECSFALEEVGRTGKANRLRKRARAIADRYGYHDIAYMAEHSTPRGRPRTPSRVSKTTRAIVSEVSALDTDHRPLVAIAPAQLFATDPRRRTASLAGHAR